MTNLKEKLEQFRKLDAARTQGNWYSIEVSADVGGDGSSEVWVDTGITVAVPKDGYGEYGEQESNSAFISYAANNALPALEQAMAEIERLENMLFWWLPKIEPNPHSKDKAIQIKQQKWMEACKMLENAKIMVEARATKALSETTE